MFADEGQTRWARTLHFIIWSLLLVVDTQFLVFFFLMPDYWVRVISVLFTFNLTLPVFLLLNHYGRTGLASILLLVMLWLLGTVLAVTAGGTHNLSIWMYLVDVLIAGLLFGARGGLIAAIVFSLTVMVIVILQGKGFFLGRRIEYSRMSIWLGFSIFLEFIAIFQFMAHRTLLNALNQARQAKEELRRSHDELEIRVKERTAELREVNNELESFSYSVSHDLRRPLRAVTGFTDLLMEGHAHELSEDGQNLLTMIKDSTAQMNHLIEALLSLSRIDREPLVPRPVNLTALVREIIPELQRECPDLKMDVRVADLPECMGDPALLRQVFVNLLSNAVKYSRTRPVTVIEVGFKPEDAQTVYFVRDNGVGFDMKYADKLFGVFQRLHSAEQFAGTGVGLSIVQRIIHRHGGKIWAEAKVDQGATFYFTLPVARS